MADLRLLPAVYADLLPLELIALLDGHREGVLEGRRNMRYLASIVWNVGVDKKYRLTPEKLFPLPGDEGEPVDEKPTVPPSVMIHQLNALFGNIE